MSQRDIRRIKLKELKRKRKVERLRAAAKIERQMLGEELSDDDVDELDEEGAWRVREGVLAAGVCAGGCGDWCCMPRGWLRRMVDDCPPPPPQRCIGRGGGPLPPQGTQPMPSHCPPDGQCQAQWHL